MGRHWRSVAERPGRARLRLGMGAQMNPRQLQASPPQVRNVPLRPRAWRELIATPGAVLAERPAGTLALVPQRGELHLYWSFEGVEGMRSAFAEMWDELRPHINTDVA